MKTFSTRRSGSAMLLGISLMMASCSKKDGLLYQASSGVQFQQVFYEVSENSDALAIDVIFQPALSRNATLTLLAEDVNSVYGTDYTTQPAIKDGKIVLQVSKGATSATIRMFPVKNNLYNDARCIKLSFPNNQEGFTFYGNPQTTVQLTDDEVSSKLRIEPIQVSFPENYGKAYEAHLRLEPAASGDGFVEMTYSSQNALYGTHFSTSPSGSDGHIRIPVTTGADLISFGISPIDNNIPDAARTIVFSISRVSENLKPSGNTQFTLRISNDDQ